MMRRVVITGMGTINALGHNLEETWASLLAGTSGVGPITLFDASRLLVQIACEVKDYSPEDYLEPKQARRLDRYQQFAQIAAREALAQSGLQIPKSDPTRMGVMISTAVGGLMSLEAGIRLLDERGPRRLSPFMIPMFMPNGAAGLIAIETGAQGPSFSIASACASGSDTLGQAWTLIRSGAIDACIAGASEATITEIGLGCFDRMGALSRRNDPPYRTPAPFDSSRDGLVMGEGAAVLILEELEQARARGATILGELVGYGSTADAYHVTAPSESGQGGAAAMRIAMETAGLRPEQVGYINAHGTGTVLNDLSETRAIKVALGEHAYNVAISSTKSMTGHIMGATGALEAIVCVQVLREGIIPPTINLRDPDPACDLDYVPGEARKAEVEAALSNAFGFGGHNATLAFRRFQG